MHYSNFPLKEQGGEGRGGEEERNKRETEMRTKEGKRNRSANPAQSWLRLGRGLTGTRLFSPFLPTWFPRPVTFMCPGLRCRWQPRHTPCPRGTCWAGDWTSLPAEAVFCPQQWAHSHPGSLGPSASPQLHLHTAHPPGSSTPRSLRQQPPGPLPHPGAELRELWAEQCHLHAEEYGRCCSHPSREPVSRPVSKNALRDSTRKAYFVGWKKGKQLSQFSYSDPSISTQIPKEEPLSRDGGVLSLHQAQGSWGAAASGSRPRRPGWRQRPAPLSLG